MPARFFLIVLLAISSFLLFFRIGTTPLYDYDEAHYAQVVRETLESGDILTMKRFGGTWFEKPPFILWLTMGSVKIFGENELSLRLPSALFGVLAVWGVYLVTYFLTKDYWTALAAASILIFSGMFPASARQFRMDVPLAATVVFALHGFLKGWGNPRWYPAFWVWTGFGVMIKSAPAFLSLPIIIIFSIVYKKWEWLKSFYFWLGTLLFLLLTLPWHVYETLQFGSAFWDSYFGYHIWQRATQKILGGDVTTLDYLYHLGILNEPWFFLSLLLAAVIFLNYKKQFAGYQLAVASFLSGILIFLVFAVARTKLIFYLVPILPFEAIFIASATLYLRSLWRKSERFFKIIGSVALLIGIVSTLLQLFYFKAPYAYSFAEDEREIGKLIKNNDNGHRIYSFGWKAYETIYYYSGKNNIELVSKEELTRGLPIPYFLLMPSTYLPAKEQPGTKVLFAGDQISLIEVFKRNR